MALWRYRILTGDLLDRLFPGRSARLLKDGRAFIEYADIRGRLEPGAARRLDGVFAGDVSFAVEVGEWQPGRLSVGLAEPGGKGCPKLEFVPGKGGATLVKYSSGGKMASGSADPLPAGLSDKVRLRLERSGSDCRVHIGDAAVGTFRTDFTGPLQPVVKALEKAVEVRSVTVSGRPDEQWIGEKLRAAAPK